jgi:hypothetical protein
MKTTLKRYAYPISRLRFGFTAGMFQPVVAAQICFSRVQVLGPPSAAAAGLRLLRPPLSGI